VTAALTLLLLPRNRDSLNQKILPNPGVAHPAEEQGNNTAAVQATTCTASAEDKPDTALP